MIREIAGSYSASEGCQAFGVVQAIPSNRAKSRSKLTTSQARSISLVHRSLEAMFGSRKNAIPDVFGEALGRGGQRSPQIAVLFNETW